MGGLPTGDPMAFFFFCSVTLCRTRRQLNCMVLLTYCMAAKLHGVVNILYAKCDIIVLDSLGPFFQFEI